MSLFAGALNDAKYSSAKSAWELICLAICWCWAVVMVEVEGPEDSNILIFCKKTCNHLIIFGIKMLSCASKIALHHMYSWGYKKGGKSWGRGSPPWLQEKNLHKNEIHTFTWAYHKNKFLCYLLKNSNHPFWNIVWLKILCYIIKVLWIVFLETFFLVHYWSHYCNFGYVCQNAKICISSQNFGLVNLEVPTLELRICFIIFFS